MTRTKKKRRHNSIAVKTDQISVKHLKIDYKKEPPKPVCPKDPWCPCTTAYTNQYYKNTKFRCVKNKVKKYICAACPKGKQWFFRSLVYIWSTDFCLQNEAAAQQMSKKKCKSQWQWDVIFQYQHSRSSSLNVQVWCQKPMPERLAPHRAKWQTSIHGVNMVYGWNPVLEERGCRRSETIRFRME